TTGHTFQWSTPMASDGHQVGHILSILTLSLSPAPTGSYGSGLMETFKNNAADAGICIAYMESIPANGDDAIYDAVVQSLLTFRNARVVACFCEGPSVRALLQAKKRLNIPTEF